MKGTGKKPPLTRDDRLFTLARRLGIEFPPPPYRPELGVNRYSQSKYQLLMLLVGSHFISQQPEFKRGPGAPKGTKWTKPLSKNPAAKRKREQRAREREREVGKEIIRRLVRPERD